jgi:hypothetical protein
MAGLTCVYLVYVAVVAPPPIIPPVTTPVATPVANGVYG